MQFQQFQIPNLGSEEFKNDLGRTSVPLPIPHPQSRYCDEFILLKILISLLTQVNQLYDFPHRTAA